MVSVSPSQGVVVMSGMMGVVFTEDVVAVDVHIDSCDFIVVPCKSAALLQQPLVDQDRVLGPAGINCHRTARSMCPMVTPQAVAVNSFKLNAPAAQPTCDPGASRLKTASLVCSPSFSLCVLRDRAYQAGGPWLYFC